jgi:hypothetical protein
MFSGPARIQTVLDDIVAYVTPDLVVFAGREHGTYTDDSERAAMIELSEVRSICVFRYIEQQGGWSIITFHLTTRISSPGISARCAAHKKCSRYPSLRAVIAAVQRSCTPPARYHRPGGTIDTY